MVEELATLQKKQAKTKTKRSSGGTKIVVLPQNSSQGNGRSVNESNAIEALRRSLM